MDLRKVKGGYLWKIHNFINLRRGTVGTNEIIVQRGGRETKWRVILEKCFRNQYSVHLELIGPFPETCKSSCSIVDKDGGKIDERFLSQTFTEKENKWPLGRLGKISREKLIKDKYSLLPDGILTISFSISPVKDEECDVLSAQEVAPSLFVAYEKLFHDKSGDIKLIVGEGDDAKEFYVHKAVISVRSPVFDAMLSSDMKEGATKVVNITDISSDIVEDFLYYLYTNRIRNLEKKDKDLIVVADKYDVVQLKNICVKSLCEKVTVATVTELLQISGRNNCEILKESCIKLILKKPTAVIKTEGWKKFEKNGENITVFAEVMKRLIKHNYADSDENDEDEEEDEDDEEDEDEDDEEDEDDDEDEDEDDEEDE